MSLTVREPGELVSAMDRIHDRWFDVDSITYDSSARLIRIPFWSQPTSKAPWDRVKGQLVPFDDLMVIHDAEAPTIEDSEHIGIYMFNDVVVRGNRLIIRAEPNLRISSAVGNLHITLGEDGQLQG